jgi:hypothetical protein
MGLASIPVSRSGLIGPMTYSPDGKLLAAALPGGGAAPTAT